MPIVATSSGPGQPVGDASRAAREAGRRPGRACVLWACLSCLALVGCDGEIDPGHAGPGVRRGSLQPAPAGLRTLTPPQYEATVRGVLGLGPAGSDEAPVAPLGQWATSEGAARGGLSPQIVGEFEEAARDAAAYMFSEPARRDAWVGCTPALGPGDACTAAFVARVGRRAVRRDLDDEEFARWTGLAEALGAAEGSAHRGLELTLSGLLQSPNFLYRVELGEVGLEAGDLDGRVPYTDHEMATRLAFLLWGEGPDEGLLDAADLGELSAPDDLDRVIDAMLDDPRAARGVERFLGELLSLDALSTLDKDAEVLPGFASLRAPLRDELLRTAVQGLAEGGFPGMFRTRSVFASPETAALFGLDPAALPATMEAGPLEGRAGILTTPGFLAMHAYPGKTSPALRGLAVRRTFLCQDIPPPPPGVSTVLPTMVGTELVTARELVAAHQTEPSCAGCHSLIDPIGLGLERFDTVGVRRDTENGLPIDEAGQLDGAPFSDSMGLGAAVASHPALLPCMASKLLAYAEGITVPTRHRDVSVLARGTGDVRAMLRALARSDHFRFSWPLPIEEAAP